MIRTLLVSLCFVALMTGCASTGSQSSAPENYMTKDGQVSILWQNPDQYTDIEATTTMQSKFDNYLFSNLTDYLGQVANPMLGSVHTLELVVTNVDLAGSVEPTFAANADELRVVSELYPPRLVFSYKLMQGNTVVKQGNENINDMGFLFGIQPINNDPFPYERRILIDWFNKTIKPTLLGE